MTALRPAEVVPLGRTGVHVTRLGFGGGPLGNLYAEVPDAVAAASLQAAWDAGVRYFDTAPHYGLGLSERRMGSFLAGVERSSFTLSTKVGRLLVPAGDPRSGRDQAFEVPATHRRVWDFSRDGVRRSLADSLTRLGTDRVDVLFLHDATDHLDQAIKEGFPALAELRDQHVVGAIGAGIGDAAALTTLVSETDLDVVMLAGRYTLLDHRAADDLLPLCLERGVAVLAAAVFNSGLTASRRPASVATFDYAAPSADRLSHAARIADVCERHGVTLPQAALQFPFRHPAVAGVVVGMRAPHEVTADADLLARHTPPQLWADLAAAGLIDGGRP